MLGFLRKRKRNWIIIFFLGLIILSFVVFYGAGKLHDPTSVQVAEWQQKWGGGIQRLDARGDSGKLYSKAEQSAAGSIDEWQIAPLVLASVYAAAALSDRPCAV